MLMMLMLMLMTPPISEMAKEEAKKKTMKMN